MTKYAIFLAVLVLYHGLSSILGAPKIRELANGVVTEAVRMRLYWSGLLGGWLLLLVVLATCLLCGVPMGDVGLGPPRFAYDVWATVVVGALCCAATGRNVALSIRSQWRVRHGKAQPFPTEEELKDIRARMVNMMIPRSKTEKRVFLGLSLMAGLSEEVMFRGFLFFLIATVFPGLPAVLIAVLTSAFFGVCHFYQGIRGAARVAAIGMLFGLLYLATDSLWLCIALHFVMDGAAAFAFPAEAEEPM